MTDTTVQIIVGAIAPTLVGIGTLVVSIISSIKSNASREKADSQRDLIINKATQIHSDTNGNLSKLTNKLVVAEQKIDGLENLVRSMLDAKAVADEVAHGLAQKVPSQRMEDATVFEQKETVKQ